MNLQARKDRASTTSPLDSIEVVLDTDNQALDLVVHTIELVSGVNVTHGGGAQPGEYLHYKSIDRDADGDGIIDYSNVIMELSQEEQGTSVIKVKCQITEVNSYKSDIDAWVERREVALGAGEVFTEETPPPPPTTELTTGEITLEWTEDTFV